MTSKEFNTINIFVQLKKLDKHVSLVFILMLFMIFRLQASAEITGVHKKISIERNPVLIADTVRKLDPKQFVQSSVNQLKENIYCSSLGSIVFVEKQFPNVYFRTESLDLEEIIGLNSFYKGEYIEALKRLISVFESTSDSSQKAQTCLNLIKISFLSKNFDQANLYLNYAKKSLKGYYSYKQKYELILTEAKIALAQGLTSKAERLIISSALPMSSRVAGRLNEFNCYLFLGKIYLKANAFTQAKWFFIQANSLAVQKHYINGQIETSLLLAKTKIKVGDKAVALQDLAKARRLIDADHQIYAADLKSLTNLAGR